MLITLLTDFGLDSHYVAQMKGVLYDLADAPEIVDISHSVRPQNVRQAAFIIDQVVDTFPRDTCHVVVVDPGVGSKRRILLARSAEQFLIGPDNGVLAPLLERHPPDWVREITETRFWRKPTSQTFHGRDIMAPTAAHLANGVSPASLGASTMEWCVLPPHELKVDRDRLEGVIIEVDSFGNLISNISSQLLPRIQAQSENHSPAVTLYCRRDEAAAEVRVRIVSTYAQGTIGEEVALIGSGGHLEIAVVNGNAAETLAAEVGDRIVVTG